MATYKTPGVYVEEISTLPASIAQVETAIPAFIGWTENVEYKGKSLKNVPTRITSLVDFEELFGGAPSSDDITVDLDANNSVSTVEMDSQFYLYESLQLFYANGGGACYIVSAGKYTDAYDGSNMRYGSYASPDSSDGLASALKKLEKYDEPTLILFPDAVLLSGNGLYDLQKEALGQAAKLQDRFVVMDLIETDSVSWETGKDNFRERIGVNNLKYGAAYTPYLEASRTVDVRYRDLSIEKLGVSTSLKTLTNVTDLKNLVSDVDTAVADTDLMNDGDVPNSINGLKQVRGIYDTLSDKWDALSANVTAAVDAVSGEEAAVGAVFQYLVDLAEMVEDWNDASSGAQGTSISTDIDNQISDPLTDALTDTMAYLAGANTQFTWTITATYDELAAGGGNPWGIAVAPAADATIYSGTSDAERIMSGMIELKELFTTFHGSISALVDGADLYEDNAEDALYSGFPIYKSIVDAVADEAVILPPSGAIVGQYAAVDSARGVWKAPANVSLNMVSGLTYTIDNDEQAGLNVDANAGKSINAIRAFTGKGILIWGARTLAGNDNEWRYVPVRRLYITVEESIRKATEFVVFEPNDANTWIRVKGMITNYLTGLWRQGALAGAKPEQAFFVNVGLGETMTAQDILEGRLIVEIGMAAVRPAEFIILRFSHKLQEA